MEGLNKTFKELGNQIEGSIPKIKVGSSKPIDDPLVDKMKRWLLIGLTILVAGGAAILIIGSLIKKVF